MYVCRYMYMYIYIYIYTHIHKDGKQGESVAEPLRSFGNSQQQPLQKVAGGQVRLGGNLAFFVGGGLMHKKSPGHPAEAQHLNNIKLGIHPRTKPTPVLN